MVVIPICLNTREYPGLDLDTESEAIAAWLRSVLGASPVVRRRDGKDHTPWIPKGSLKFVDKEGKFHLLEILGTGEQAVIEGPHKLGTMQYWENGGLIEHASELPEIDIFMCDGLLKQLKAEAESMGLTPVKGSLHTGSSDASAYKIADLMSPLIEPNRERLTSAIQHIDINDERINYVFIALLCAICASVSGDHAYFERIVWPWCCTHSVRKGNGPLALEQGMEWYLERWDSFHDSPVGPETVYAWAARCGYDETLVDFQAEKAEGIFGALPDDEDAPTLGGAPAGAAGGSGSTGPLPFTFTDTAVANTFAGLHPEWRHTPDQDWVRYEGGVYVPNDMVKHDISEVCIAVGAPFRSQGPTQANIDMGMNRSKKHSTVERRLRYHPGVHAKPGEFDADPWMLNTPKFIVDLRTGEFHGHTGQLMRQQTLVAPSILALNDYERYCPRFMAYLDFIAAGRDHVIPFLQRWGSYNLVGE